ncbi:CsgG/HfaB family protein [Aurantimonas marina]|uniref:CsgG/HfaB family protein n=1 Tax=Aurantimonas marina TaxID=2780508 RepID=UPI001E3F6EAB|nr:CsgG/HfaB family protein [Aurantimonas marina]
MISEYPGRARLARRFALTLCIAPLAGCVTTESYIDTLPVVAPVSYPNDALRRLPPPAKKTAVAVYDLEDLTGQFKERENVQTLSRAVTQGGAAILIKALQDAGERRWFMVLERKELDDLLKERQIITEMRRLYRGEEKINANVLPPLLHAGIIVQGGIIGYDTNTVTGGAGANFLGIGGDAKYIQDVVTVTLRAVSTKTGEVLTSVTTRKAVASYSLQGGAFRYVKLDELLQAEAGTTYNEPKQIAVQSAVEKAVEAMIVEGAELGVWSFADRAAGQAYIAAYRDEKYGFRLTAGAVSPSRPQTANAGDVVDTVPARPVRVTQRRVVQPKSSAAPVTPRVVTPPPAQPIVRRVPGVNANGSDAKPAPGQVRGQPAQEAPRDLPPAPAPDEPAVGSNDSGAEDAPRTLIGMLFR